MWQQWTNLVLGLWVIVVPFLGFSASVLMWVLAITGIVMAGLALWGVTETQAERTEGRMTATRHAHA